MRIPVQVTLRGLRGSRALDELIRKRAKRLERFQRRLVSARVVVELGARHRHKGKPFVVRIDLKTPLGEIAVARQQHEDPRVAVRDAFDAARRRLQDQPPRKRRSAAAASPS